MVFPKEKTYKSKLLLFGEHILIKGAQALAIPFSMYRGSWRYTSLAKKEELQMQLPKLASWLNSKQIQGQLGIKLDIDAFVQALDQGLYFDSNIPVGYGVGSSGALCAGIYDQFAVASPTNLLAIKNDLSELESFFHGASSGIDPLVAYMEKAVLISSKTDIQTVGLNTDFEEGTLFILDTQIRRKTGPLVELFLERCEDEHYYNRILSELIPLNDNVIDAYLHNNWSLLWELIHEISFFQFKYFDSMIPNTFKPLWLDGLGGNLYKLKLCGAGGGGFILGFTNDYKQAKKALSRWKIHEIFH